MENDQQITIKAIVETLDLNLEIEFKGKNIPYQLIIARSKSQIPGDQGKIWHAAVENEKSIREIIELANTCHENPSKARFITINDGMHVTFTLILEKTISFTVKDFEDNTAEQLLIQKLLEICQKSVDSSFDKYVSQIRSFLK